MKLDICFPKKNIMKAIIKLLTIVILITTVLSCSNSNLEKTSIRLRWITQSQFAGIFYANQKGYFKENGLEVEVNSGGPNVNYMQIVGSNAEDFGICGATQIIEARDKGLPVVALATIFKGNPNIFFAKKGRGIDSPLDWPGKKVAVFYGYDHEVIYKAILKKLQIDPKTIEEYPVTIDITPFLSDKVDVWGGYIINQPLVAEEKGFDIIRFYPNDYGVVVSGDVLFTTEKVIREKPELVSKVVNSVIKGWEDAMQNKDEAVDAVLNLDSKLNKDHEKNMIMWVDSLIYDGNPKRKIGWIEKENWENMVELWEEFNLTNNKIEPESCYDASFIQEYYKK